MSFWGSNDSSIQKQNEDLFNVTNYVDGLTSFINNCVTPMTISIQGDWGSGKTSMMNMVKDKLGKDVLTVWFNTWQYSQFNMGDDLSLSLLGRLIKEIQDGEKNEALNKTLKVTYSAVKAAGKMAMGAYLGSQITEHIEKLAENFAEGNDDVIDAISKLKDEFEAAVKKKLVSSHKKRLVVFIDDLDRLNPGKAVELLEVLKIFLDCDNCVFVLAIDYSVVSQGVKEKYGDLIGEDKGKSFFDKIIQVPFKMPVAHYKVEKFVIDMFKQVNISLDTEKANIYVDLIRYSVGCNPRTMKRLFNAFLLLNCVSNSVGNKDAEDEWHKRLLFAILCCQQSFEKLYNIMVRYSDKIENEGLLEKLITPAAYKKNESSFENQSEEILVNAFKNTSTDEIYKMTRFMEYFFKIVDKDGNHDLDPEELEKFVNVLNLTTITSAGNNEPDGDKSKFDKEAFYLDFWNKLLAYAKFNSEYIKAFPKVKAKGNYYCELRMGTSQYMIQHTVTVRTKKLSTQLVIFDDNIYNRMKLNEQSVQQDYGGGLTIDKPGKAGQITQSIDFDMNSPVEEWNSKFEWCVTSALKLKAIVEKYA